MITWWSSLRTWWTCSSCQGTTVPLCALEGRPHRPSTFYNACQGSLLHRLKMRLLKTAPCTKKGNTITSVRRLYDGPPSGVPWSGVNRPWSWQHMKWQARKVNLQRPDMICFSGMVIEEAQKIQELSELRAGLHGFQQQVIRFQLRVGL